MQPAVRYILIVVVTLILAIGMVAGAGFWYVNNNKDQIAENLFGMSPEEVSAIKAREESGEEKIIVKPAQELQFVPLAPIVLTIPSEKRVHYLMLELVITTYSSGSVPLASLDPLLRNSLVSLFAGKTYDELKNVKVDALQIEIREAFKQVLKSQGFTNPIENVLFTKMVLQ